MRFRLVGMSLVLIVSSCSDGQTSLTEYVERVNVLVGRALQQSEVLVASPRGAVLVAGPTQFTDFTPQDLQAGLEGVIEIEVEFLDAINAIDPPELVADLHDRWFDATFTSIEIALAARAGTAADWEELSESPEMAAYRVGFAEDKQICNDFRAQLDATAERVAFADTPWIPTEMKEVVESIIDCSGYPESPEDAYRPPPASTS